MRRVFEIGDAWYSEGANRGPLAYLRCVRRQPGFFVGIAAALAFAGAGYKEFGLAQGVAIYGGALAGILLLGYMIWLIVVSRH